jgi:hypothetical protein
MIEIPVASLKETFQNSDGQGTHIGSTVAPFAELEVRCAPSRRLVKLSQLPAL